MAQLYFSLVTNTGKIKLAASAAGGPQVTITHLAIGDGNGAETNPTAASVELVHEVWRTGVESVVTDPLNPAAILVTALIPTAVGGWWMREFGIFDVAGDMIAVAKPVSQYKPTALEGQLEDIRYEFQIVIGETAAVTLLVDPSILLASRAWVEARKTPTNRLAATPFVPVISAALAGPPGAPVAGDLYLIPAAPAGAWVGHAHKLAEWTGQAWAFIDTPNGHRAGTPDGRAYVKLAGAYRLDRFYVLDTGAANALVVAPGRAVDIGDILRVKLAASITGAASIAVDGGAAAALTFCDGAALAAGAGFVGEIVTLVRTDAGYALLDRRASEAAIGMVRLATAAETTAGALNSKAVHPAGLAAALAAYAPALPAGIKPSHLVSSRTNQASHANNVFTIASGLATASSQFRAGTVFNGSTLTIGAADAGLWFFNMMVIMTTEEIAIRVFHNGAGLLSVANGDGYIGDTEYGRYVACSGSVPVAAGDLITFRTYQRNTAGNSKTASNIEVSGFRLE